jgi:hypothetical protein
MIPKTVEETIEEIKSEFPNFKLVAKQDSWLMKVINVFLIIITFGQNRMFMKGFITTIGTTIYTNETWDTNPVSSKVAVLRHERVHMRQNKRLTTPLYVFLYLFFPLPFLFAYGRAKLEWEAYTESIRTQVHFHGIDRIKNDEDYRHHTISHFTNSEYLWMFPFRSILNKWYDKAISQIEAELEKQ